MRDLTIKASSLIKTYGTSDALQVGLFDGNNPLANYPLQIIINGVTYNRTTESDGYTWLNINLPVGEYETTIKYNGSGTYNSATKYVAVKVLSNHISQSQTKKAENYFELNGIPLIVKLSDGFSVTPGINIKETDMLMQTATMNAPTYYFNQGNHGVIFDISVLMRESYRYDNYTVMDYLDLYHKNMTPVSIVTDALDVPNSKYMLNIKSKKQTNRNFSIWKLEFHQYYEDHTSFEKMYTEKQSTLSSDDLELLKYQTINSDSPSSAIKALQRKLMAKGSFKPLYTREDYVRSERQPNGIWDEDMALDIFLFQVRVMGTSKKQGVCDRDTINALVNDDNYQYEGIFQIHYHEWERNAGR